MAKRNARMWAGVLFVTAHILLSGLPAVAADRNELNERPMRFEVVRFSTSKCEPKCPEWISAEGRIISDTPKRLAEFLKTADRLRLPIIINSGGGNIEAAVELGRMIRNHKMTTAVGHTVILDCREKDHQAGKCKPDKETGVLSGIALPNRSYCASACPLMLLGGSRRIIDELAFIGLHEPSGEKQSYIDKYLIKYRIVNGKKEEISRTFVKRTLVEKKRVVGVTSELRQTLVPYLKEMGGDVAILDEMEKADPKDMNWIKPASGKRLKLGLMTPPPKDHQPKLEDLVQASICISPHTEATNCVVGQRKP